jgi:hypothetical protein
MLARREMRHCTRRDHGRDGRKRLLAAHRATYKNNGTNRRVYGRRNDNLAGAHECGIRLGELSVGDGRRRRS